MGMLQSKASNFKWIDRYELIDLDNNDKILKLMSRVGQSEYIGKEIVCYDLTQIQIMEQIIDKKILNPSPYLIKLVKVGYKIQNFQCNQSKVFCLVFKKPFRTLKEESIYRKFQKQSFTEADIECILQSCVRGLSYLKNLGQSHGKISSNSIYINQDRTILLGDPWLLRDETDFNLKLYGSIYPSPQKILYQNGYIKDIDIFLSDLFSLGVMLLDLFCLQHMDIIYQKGFRRLIQSKVVQKINYFKSPQLKKKLRIILSHQASQRLQILTQYFFNENKIQKFISFQKQSFKKQYIKNTLVTSQVKTVKIGKKDNHFTLDNHQKYKSSRNPSDISSDTIPQLQNINQQYPAQGDLANQKITFIPKIPRANLSQPYIQFRVQNPARINSNYPTANTHQSPVKIYKPQPINSNKEFTFNRRQQQTIQQNSVKSISSISKNESGFSAENIQLELLQGYKRYAENCRQINEKSQVSIRNYQKNVYQNNNNQKIFTTKVIPSNFLNPTKLQNQRKIQIISMNKQQSLSRN